MKCLNKLLIFCLFILSCILFACEKKEIPTLVTTEVTEITATSATSGGNITNDGGASVITRGVCYSTNQIPTDSDSKTSDGSGAGIYNSGITGLNGATKYYVRAYATNSEGTGYGSEVTFTTLGALPEALSQTATDITSSGATLNGTVNANYLSTTVTFEYGLTTNYSSTSTATQSPVTGNASTNVSATISELKTGYTYHFRIKTVNYVGTSYGSDLTFTTILTDIEDNVYNSVTIGTQIWMKENLRTTKYRNGDLIGTTSPATLDISGETSPKYQWAYSGNESYVATYGRLYTWYALTDSRDVCPTGWHLPTNDEWATLEFYLGGSSVAGGKLKDTTLWTSPNIGATNSSGFTALPGGHRGNDGSYTSIRWRGDWWSATETNASDAWGSGLNDSSSSIFIYGYYPKSSGFSVRCIKD